MTRELLQKPTALFGWTLDVDCPSCEKEVDLNAYDSEHDYGISKHLFNNNWDKLQGYEITCPHCNHEFELEKVEY